MNHESDARGEPLVSVVIPTYNRANYIAETIESVLNQTYRNIEIIVIDDGSTDNTSEVVKQFASRICYVPQVNSERGASRNHGLRLAQGQYIAFLDSDDLWLPAKVEEDVRFLQAHPGVGVVYTDAVQVDSEGRELRLMHADGPSGHVTGSLLLRNFISIGTHLIRTELIRDVGGFVEDRQLSGCEDWEMWVRLSLRTEFAYNPVATTKIRTHSENTMTNAKAMHRATSRAAELFNQQESLTSDYAKELKRMSANLALVNAINYCSQGDRKRSAGFLKEAFSSDPRIVLDLRYAYTIFRLLKTGLRTAPATSTH